MGSVTHKATHGEGRWQWLPRAKPFTRSPSMGTTLATSPPVPSGQEALSLLSPQGSLSPGAIAVYPVSESQTLWPGPLPLSPPPRAGQAWGVASSGQRGCHGSDGAPGESRLKPSAVGRSHTAVRPKVPFPGPGQCWRVGWRPCPVASDGHVPGLSAQSYCVSGLNCTSVPCSESDSSQAASCSQGCW